MRVAAGVLAVGITLGMAGAAGAQTYVKGNDTGGIIAWSCESELLAHDIAAAHCARFNKFHRITSVHRQPGDYIGFHCLWNPRKAPFAIPAVGTRKRACPGPIPTISVRY
jgi:hypothetical protein